MSLRALPATLAVLLLGIAGTAAAGPARAAPIGERLVGWDTYRHLDRLPYLSAGEQMVQVSSFDRSGGNFDISTGNDNGSGGCLASGGAGCVVAEDRGAGEIDSIWFTRDSGNVTRMGRIRIELDGQVVVDAPLQSVANGALGAPFVWPLVANAAQSPAGVYIKVPMPYRQSMRISIASNLQYYHVDYRRFSAADGVATFSASDPALDVINALRAAGTTDPKPAAADTRHDTRAVDLPAASGLKISESAGPGTISALRLRLPPLTDELLNRLRVRIEFDDRTAVDSPLGEFFGAGLGASDVRSLMFATAPQPDGSVVLSAWWPMPFAHAARVTLLNPTDVGISGVETDVATTPDTQWGPALADGRAGYFTARSHAGPTVPGQDWVFADEGGHGKFVGVSHTIRGSRIKTSFGDAAPYFLEGAERVYTDGSESPQWYGTGTEDFYEGGWYFDNGTHFTDPLTGQPDQRTSAGGCADYCDAVYRVMLADAIGYHSGIRFGIEHGKRNMVLPDYSSTAFLYSQPGDTVTRTDEVDPADPFNRALHGYTDADGTDELLLSSYEGSDDLHPVAAAIHSTGSALTFHIQVDPKNHGVLLRRTSDQLVGYQSVAVTIDGATVGLWIAPRSNPFHRWLEDTYFLPESLTAGKAVVAVTLAPVPGAPPWTASRYRVDALS